MSRYENQRKAYGGRDELVKDGPITIVAFGDSVTHGALGAGVINYETVYWNLLKRKLNAVRNYIPVNVINAGIGGLTAKQSLDRMDRQVLAHEPDLVIVAFGLNDVNGTLDDYLSSLRVFFSRTPQPVSRIPRARCSKTTINIYISI